MNFAIRDLGRPEWFLHMLQVFKPTSPSRAVQRGGRATATVDLLGWLARLKRFGAETCTATGLGLAILGGAPGSGRSHQGDAVGHRVAA